MTSMAASFSPSSRIGRSGNARISLRYLSVARLAPSAIRGMDSPPSTFPLGADCGGVARLFRDALRSAGPLGLRLPGRGHVGVIPPVALVVFPVGQHMADQDDPALVEDLE